MIDSPKLIAAVDDFLDLIDDLDGHYLDSCSGFGEMYNKIVMGQQQAAKIVPAGTDLDALKMLYGKGDPNVTNNVTHQTTQGEFKSRNQKGGKNHIRAAQLFIVLAYSFWESRHRQEIATALDIEVDELKVPIMGDLRRLRHDVVHNRAIVQAETEKRLEVLGELGLKSGQEIVLDDDQVLRLARLLTAALVEIRVKT